MPNLPWKDSGLAAKGGKDRLARRGERILPLWLNVPPGAEYLADTVFTDLPGGAWYGFGGAENKKAHLQTEDGPFNVTWFISSVAWQSFDEGSMALRRRITAGLLLSEIIIYEY